MRYINTFKLIHTMFEHKPLDSRALLADVNQHVVMQALNRSKGGMPKSIQFTNVRMEHPALAKMRPGDKERLWEIYERVRAFPNEEIPKLLELQQQYPHVPPIYNYIGIAYACSSQEDKYFEILLETNRRFPEYLFGKTALADYYLTHHEHKKVPKILDKKFELWQHYPTIELFHVSEVRSFFNVAGTYFARVNKIAKALYHYFVLVSIDPDHPATKKVGDEILLKEIDNLNRIFSKRRSRRKRK